MTHLVLDAEATTDPALGNARRSAPSSSVSPRVCFCSTSRRTTSHQVAALGPRSLRP